MELWVFKSALWSLWPSQRAAASFSWRLAGSLCCPHSEGRGLSSRTCEWAAGSSRTRGGVSPGLYLWGRSVPSIFPGGEGGSHAQVLGLSFLITCHRGACSQAEGGGSHCQVRRGFACASMNRSLLFQDSQQSLHAGGGGKAGGHFCKGLRHAGSGEERHPR